jgi:hypothetical protein
MNNSVEVYDGMRGDIQVSRPPEIVLEEARKAATVLHDVLVKKEKKVMMNGEQYLEFEDWQTVARFYGITAKVKETNFVDFGGVKGFEATAVAVRSDGMEISQADAMCLNDEEKWSTRTKYGYLYILKDGTKQEEDPPKDQIVWIDNPDKPGKKMPQKEKVAVGEVAVPLFQLKSMAQTRACAKVLRNVLAWVVVLAGYKPTPAEELTGDEGGNGKDKKPPLQQPGKKSDKQETKSEGNTVTVKIGEITSKDGKKKDGSPYTIFTIFDEGGTKYATFDTKFSDLAELSRVEGFPVAITFTEGQFGRKVTNLVAVERTPGDDPE